MHIGEVEAVSYLSWLPKAHPACLTTLARID